MDADRLKKRRDVAHGTKALFELRCCSRIALLFLRNAGGPLDVTGQLAEILG